jgi:predicted site-specific integrase-resolvase
MPGLTLEEIDALPAALTPRDYAEVYGVSIDTAYTVFHDGTLPVINVGRRLFLPKVFVQEQLGMLEGTEQ